jgi:hypothetical protein
MKRKEQKRLLLTTLLMTLPALLLTLPTLLLPLPRLPRLLPLLRLPLLLYMTLLTLLFPLMEILGHQAVHRRQVKLPSTMELGAVMMVMMEKVLQVMMKLMIETVKPVPKKAKRAMMH